MSRRTAFGACVVVAMLAMVAAAVPASGAVTGSSAAGGTIRIWTDKDRRADIEKIANAWAARRGVQVEVVEKNFGDIRDQLKTVAVASAPDVIIGAHDWTGQLAADGLVLPISPKKATLRQFPKYSLDAFSYGTAVKRLYGAPVALENVGLVVNTRLATVPRTFANLEKQALAFKAKSSENLAIAVPQAPAGDAYHMYPFFSGLGGYVFGKNKAGNLNPKQIGVANPVFLRNAAAIDRWDRLGLINSKVNYDTAKNAFLKGRAAFWVTGPWEADTLRTSGLRFRIVQVPRLKFRSVPFLGVQGFMVSRYANTHGTATLAKDLVASYIMLPASQRALAAANGRYPANTVAGRGVRDAVLSQFGKAGAGGVPMPNIPQMSSVWEELGGAWLKSTNGTATLARPTFTTAARNIRNKIG
jgi:arabinogalactan oligomer / maltooligosaccharide transport system substrate-binding protein